MRMRIAVVGALVMAIVAVVVATIGMRGATASGYRVDLRPRHPLTLRACVAELRAKGSGFGRQACLAGDGKAWFSLHLVNLSDDLGNPTCRATAYDLSGRALFEDDLPLGLINFPAGPSVVKGSTFQFVWYLPIGDPQTYVERQHWTPSAVDHYTASCHGRSSSQLPI
jgi:hypothetical protein